MIRFGRSAGFVWLGGFFLSAVLAAVPAGAAGPASAAVPAELSIADVHQGLDSGRFTVKQLEQHYERRVETLDRAGPKLNAVIEINPDAAALASDLDGRGDRHAPLFGVPVLIKDNIDTHDRMATTAGSLALVGAPVPADAFLVSKLRHAGALILGKTNLSEWANSRSMLSSSGWSARGGQTRNPYALNRNPCGSSSGSAAAVAADLAIVAVGTETDGSIVCPSSANGLVGIKPTVGLISRAGIIPISASQDTAGPMARSVTDAAVLLTVLAGYDRNDPATEPLQTRDPVDYTAFLHTDALKGARVGVMRQHAGFQEPVDAQFEQALRVLREQGAVLVDPANLPAYSQVGNDEQTILLYEFKDGVNRYLAGRGGSIRTLTDLIAFNEHESRREMPYFGQEQFLRAEAKGPLTDRDYVVAHERARRLAGPEGIDALLVQHHLDVLVAPTMGTAWITDWLNGDRYVGGGVSVAPAVAGYPHITVPMGVVRGMPVGLSFVGTAWSEPKLIGYAFSYERATRKRQPPRYIPVVP